MEDFFNNKIKLLRLKLWDFLCAKTQEAEHNFVSFGVLTVIGYSFFYLLNIYNNHYYENLFLRLTAIIFSIPLILHQKWPAKLIYWKPIYWYFSVTFILPYFFTFMLLNNADSIEWQLNALIILTLLILLLDWISATFVTIIGILFGVITYHYFYPDKEMPHNLSAFLNALVSLLIYYALFAHKTEAISLARKKYAEHIKTINELLEQNVKARTYELEKALAAKSEFLNNMSHEIRTPIHGILNYATTLERRWQNFDDAKRFEIVQKLHFNCSRLFTLINNLLDLARLDVGKMKFKFQTADFKKVVEEVIIELHPMYEAKQSLTIKFDPEGVLLATFDVERIKQVVRNLLTNAIKFTDQGSITIKALLQNNTAKNKTLLHCIIEDEGIGIPQKELVIIFDKFIQSSRTRTGAGGTGLGLAICHDIISAHQGKIWATNNKNKGASFHFLIPVNQ